MYLEFTTIVGNLKVFAPLDEIAEVFATAFKTLPLCENKKSCFLQFREENQVNFCTFHFNENNIHLLKNAKY